VLFNQAVVWLENIFGDKFLMQPSIRLAKVATDDRGYWKHPQAVFIKLVQVLLCSHAHFVRYSLLFPDLVMPAVDCHT
jgi:hypothetical protein